MEAGPGGGLSTGDSPVTDESPSRVDDDNSLLLARKAVEAAEATIKQQAEENSRLRSELQKKIRELENYRKVVINIREPKGLGNGSVAYDELEKGAFDYGVRDELQSRNWIADSALVEKVIDADPKKGSDHNKALEKGGLSRKVVILEWLFLATNAFTELLSAVLEQLSSTRNPHFALIGLLLTFTGVCFCIIELIVKCIHEKVIWKWSRVPWFYHPSGKLFGSFRDMIGLVCALCQCTITSINYEFYRRHADAPVKRSRITFRDSRRVGS